GGQPGPGGLLGGEGAGGAELAALVAVAGPVVAAGQLLDRAEAVGVAASAWHDARSLRRPVSPRESTEGVLSRFQHCSCCDLLPGQAREAGRGAGDENRTRTPSWEDWGSTIELHPHGSAPPHSVAASSVTTQPLTTQSTRTRRGDRTRTCDLLLPKQTR